MCLPLYSGQHDRKTNSLIWTADAEKSELINYLVIDFPGEAHQGLMGSLMALLTALCSCID